MRDKALAHFQGRLLELLHAETDPDRIRAALIDEFGDSAFCGFLEQMEPRMIEVAAELVKKWGIRGEG